MMRTRMAAIVLLLASGAVFAWSARRLPAPGQHSLAERLLGPIAETAAAVQWVRVDEAWAAGRIDVCDARAAFALRLAPGDPNGWIYYGRHLVFDRGSILREPDGRDRERWVRAGLAVFDSGERLSRAPGRIAFQRAIIYLALAQMDDEERSLPITRSEAWTAAAEAFERAAKAGEPLADRAAKAAREEALEAK